MATNPWDSDPVVVPADPAFTGVIPGVPKTPSVPTGFQPDPTRPGHLMPIPGGPEDPSTNDNLDDATTTFYAQQVLAGAPMPAMGMGKVASQNRQKVMAKVAELAGAQGKTGEDLARQITHYKAGSKQLSTLENQLGTTRQNEATALANGQQFIDRSTELPLQTEYPALNSLTQFFQKHTPIEGHDTKVAMDAAWNTFTTEYAKVVAGSPSGAGTLSDSARHEAQAVLQGNYSLSQKKAVFDQMKTDMANRLTAMHQSINEGYDALTKQPGYTVPEDTSGFSVKPGNVQQHIIIPGINDNGSDPGIGGNDGGGPPTPPGVSDLSADQKQAYSAFLAANPKPDGPTLKTFLEKLTGKQVTNADDIAAKIAAGAGVSTTVEDKTEQQKVQDRIALEDKRGLGEDPITTLVTQGATLNLSDEAAGVGNAAANVITSPFTGNFDPLGAYSLGRDVERQRVVDANNALGYAAAPIEFLGGLASASPTNALSALGNVPAMIRQGAQAGAVGGGIAGFGAGQGAQQSIAGAGLGAAGGAAVGAAAPYAVNRLAPNNALARFAPDTPDVVNAAQAEGVNLLRPMVDPASRGKFGALESAPGSQNVIREGVDQVKGQIEGRVADLGQGGTAMEPGAAGEKLQLSGNRYIERSRGIKNRLYSAAENAGGNTRFVPHKAILEAEDEIAQLKANPGTNAAEINFLQSVHDDLATPGGKTVAEIRNIRTGLRGAIGTNNLTMTGAEARANGILHTAAEDISDNVPEAGRLYKRADAFYRERQTVVDDIKRSILGSKSDPLDPQKAFQNIKTLSAPGGNLRRLSAVTRYLEPDERQDVAATVASTLGRKAQDAPFSSDIFLSQTDKMSPGALRTIFGQDGAESISNLRLLSQKLKESGADINRSKTANSMLRQMATRLVASLTGLGGMAGMAEGGMTGAGSGALTGLAVGGAVKGAQVARNILSARAMVSPKLTRWLAQAADVSTPSQAKQAVKGLSLVISREPALAHELTPIRDFLDQRVTQLLAANPDDQQNQQGR
jgi:hypothetical protein